MGTVETLGLDVSHYQGKIEWAKVAAAGYRFAIVKATQDVAITDARLVANAQGVRDAGMNLQYYQFANPDKRSNDAKREAERFLTTLEAVPKPNRLWFSQDWYCDSWSDLEKACEELDEREGFAWLSTWLDLVEVEGLSIGIYSKAAWLYREVTPDAASIQKLMTRKDGTRRPFWVARYGKNNGQRPAKRFDPQRKVPVEWGPWDIWQYTSRGTVPGIDGRVDLDLARLWDVSVTIL